MEELNGIVQFWLLSPNNDDYIMIQHKQTRNQAKIRSHKKIKIKIKKEKVPVILYIQSTHTRLYLLLVYTTDY